MSAREIRLEGSEALNERRLGPAGAMRFIM